MEDGVIFPSPEMLKNKILIKNRKNPDNQASLVLTNSTKLGSSFNNQKNESKKKYEDSLGLDTLGTRSFTSPGNSTRPQSYLCAETHQFNLYDQENTDLKDTTQLSTFNKSSSLDVNNNFIKQYDDKYLSDETLENKTNDSNNTMEIKIKINSKSSVVSDSNINKDYSENSEKPGLPVLSEVEYIKSDVNDVLDIDLTNLSIEKLGQLDISDLKTKEALIKLVQQVIFK